MTEGRRITKKSEGVPNKFLIYERAHKKRSLVAAFFARLIVAKITRK